MAEGLNHPDEQNESLGSAEYESCISVRDVFALMAKRHNNLARRVAYGGLSLGMASCFDIDNQGYDQVIKEAKSDDIFSSYIPVVEATHEAMSNQDIDITPAECVRARSLHDGIFRGQTEFSDEDLDFAKKFAVKVDAVYSKLVIRFDPDKITD